MICPYWIELDDKYGMYEYCKYSHKRVICCADKDNCEYPLIESDMFRIADENGELNEDKDYEEHL